MGIPHNETLTVTFNARQVAGLEVILQQHLNYLAEEGSREERMHNHAQSIYDELSRADHLAGRCGV